MKRKTSKTKIKTQMNWEAGSPETESQNTLMPFKSLQASYSVKHLTLSWLVQEIISGIVCIQLDCDDRIIDVFVK
jgi:hypothetical protein